MRTRFAIPVPIRMNREWSDRLAGFAISPAGQYSTGTALALVAIIGLFALFLQLRQATEQITVQIPFTHNAEFRYSAAAVLNEESLREFIEDPQQIEQILNDVYSARYIDSSEDLDAETGGPIFSRIHPFIDVQITYTIDGPPEASFQGVQEYRLFISDVTGWRLDFPPISSESFSGPSAITSVVMPVQPLFDQLEAFELITGHVPRQYSGTMKGQIDTTVTYRGTTVTDRFEPKVKYLIDPPFQLFLDSKEFSSFAFANENATGSDSTPLVDTQTFTIPFQESVDARLTALGADISISQARIWTWGALALSLSGFTILATASFVGSRRSEDFRIRARFRSRLVNASVESRTAARNIKLDSIDDLVKVSNQMGLPIIRTVDQSAVVYAVNDRDTRYQYRPGVEN